ncbi:MAG: hypothetical protein K2Q33_03125, partial [Gammaproteobacteria bacterium]|nr:hypothetical protein [Gammaproteobacteria bacterium]
KQELNGLHVIAKSGIKRSILVTSHYAHTLIQEQAIKTATKILPKQLASEVPIRIAEIMPIVDSNSAAKADIVIVDDDKSFANNLALFVFEDKIVDQYHDPHHFLQQVHQYPKDTKIYLDNNFNNSHRKGLDIAKELHEQGYQRLYLLSGEAFQKGDIPDYLTVIRKDQIDSITDID